ncbi:MAG: L,D-transpeptidase family protein [Bdellovibrio bacteriovorus]
MPLRGPIVGVLCLFALAPGLVIADALLRGTAESLSEVPSAEIDGVRLLSPPLIAELYRARGHAPAWTRTEQIEALLRAAEASPSHGLRPEDFHAATLRELARSGDLARLSPRERVSAELRLTDALLRYVHHLRFGRLDPVAVNRAWNHRPPIPAETLVADMQSVLSAEDLGARLADVTPKPFFYEQLRAALGAQLATEHLRGLAPIPGGKPLGLGSRDPRVAALRARLAALGDPSAAESEEPNLFDSALSASVSAFQYRSGLTADGVVGASTLAVLNRPYDSAKADRIRINLERMRWFYDALPEDYVLVDVAGFMVHVVRGGEVVWSTRAVVGTPQDQTPSFRDEMEHLVFNPTWTVPPSIQKKMRGVSNRYKVVDRQTGRTVSGGNFSDHRRYRIVQEAGPSNALGRVKFMFPNGHAIYLHDTPSKGLFSHGTRAYSHGCVRVQHPLKLAEVVLNESSWDQAAINRVLSTNKTRYVHLDDHLPVILYYLTAKADAEGQLSLRPDLYGRDSALERAFRGPPSPVRIRFPEPESPPQPASPSEPTLPRQARAAESAPSLTPALEAQGEDLSPALAGEPGSDATPRGSQL